MIKKYRENMQKYAMLLYYYIIQYYITEFCLLYVYVYIRYSKNEDNELMKL